MIPQYKIECFAHVFFSIHWDCCKHECECFIAREQDLIYDMDLGVGFYTLHLILRSLLSGGILGRAYISPNTTQGYSEGYGNFFVDCVCISRRAISSRWFGFSVLFWAYDSLLAKFGMDGSYNRFCWHCSVSLLYHSQVMQSIHLMTFTCALYQLSRTILVAICTMERKRVL